VETFTNWSLLPTQYHLTSFETKLEGNAEHIWDQKKLELIRGLLGDLGTLAFIMTKVKYGLKDRRGTLKTRQKLGAVH
jgi:hypothetical protein